MTAGYRPTHVYFPIDCVLSNVATSSEGAQIEVDAIGREGISSIGAVVHATSAATTATWCQVAGDAYRLPVGDFRALAAARPQLRERIDGYVAATIELRGQSIVCGGLHHTTERCAKWLLLTNDRVAREEFPLTHEVLSTMLGVRRAGISLAAAALQNSGSISYARGRFTIANRMRLESQSCECYAAHNAILERHGLRPPRLPERR